MAHFIFVGRIHRFLFINIHKFVIVKNKSRNHNIRHIKY